MRRATLLGLALAACTSASARTAAKELRVCSDPNNLPFSNEAQAGFENRIADVLGEALGRRVSYTWRPQRRGFLRNTLNAGECDVVIGLPTSSEMAWTTVPYYRSTYVFVTRAADRLRIRSLDDPRLRKLRIGVHIIGDDYTNTPPVHALARRGIVNNVKGYLIYGDYSTPNPPARLIQAVADGDVDVAIAWGPLAGYFAKQQKQALDLTPVTPQVDLPFNQFVFDIGMAVRRRDTVMHEAVARAMETHRGDIDRILDEYGVPRVAKPGVGGEP